MSIERICEYCKSKKPSEKYNDIKQPKEKMRINFENIDGYVYYKEKSYHRICFEKRKRILNKLSKEEIESIYKNSKSHFEHILISDKIYRFMLANYDLTVIDNRVFQKLQNIYTGTLMGMSVGIPITDLLDMWQRKIKHLNKIHSQNITKGKLIEGNNRILYDLSVLVSKYDSYQKWKREQQILQVDSNETRNDSPKINFSIIENQVKNQSDNLSSNDLNNLLEEMF